jgi:hypothetical protein
LSEKNALGPVEAKRMAHDFGQTDDNAGVNSGCNPVHSNPAVEETESKKRGRDTEPKKENQQKKQD